MKRRLVNFRPFAMIAASLIAGILIGYAWIYGAFWAFWTIFCCMLATGIVFFVLKKKKVAICLTIAVLSFLGGFFDFTVVIPPKNLKTKRFLSAENLPTITPNQKTVFLFL